MRLPALASLLAPVLVLAAAPAFAQGSVNVYNWSDYIAEDQLKDFAKETGVKVNYTTYDSNEILDEATEGLAPLIRAEIWSCLARLKKEGQAILLVDKHLDALTKIADRHVVIEKGHVVWTGTSAQLAADPSVKTKYLQV